MGGCRRWVPGAAVLRPPLPGPMELPGHHPGSRCVRGGGVGGDGRVGGALGLPGPTWVYLGVPGNPGSTWVHLRIPAGDIAQRDSGRKISWYRSARQWPTSTSVSCAGRGVLAALLAAARWRRPWGGSGACTLPCWWWWWWWCRTPLAGPHAHMALPPLVAAGDAVHHQGERWPDPPPHPRACRLGRGAAAQPGGASVRLLPPPPTLG